MPNLMLTVHKSKYASVDETCAALKDSIEEAGWNCPAIHNINESMTQEGITFPHAIRVVELYQPSYAHDVLESNPELFALMHPCTFGVYEDSDGSVYISGMNIGLMSKLFGGHIAETIGNKITADEISILAPVIVE
ncbi:MAG: DUF302 domain-containing protein [Candidatus Hydrogenedentes bacterium]|nr:DUF302 domain-containing protein [Candidatus Hydrogenedentota bacterium]